MNRRAFLRTLGATIVRAGVFLGLSRAGAVGAAIEGAAPEEKPRYGMAIDIDRCIGCARCMEACKTENNVPQEPFYFRTWVERYVIKTDESLTVQNVGMEKYQIAEPINEWDILRSFFVPKLCNQCDHPPCTQVCPVGATFSTEEGVILIDSTRCIGCGYCIQACPYGARYLRPDTKTADKCTFCYHRITKGLLPACVEVCPTQARVFGELNTSASPLTRFKRMEMIHVLKPHLNTEPKVFYANLDGLVR
ncbi:MAG TPA: 4Fe-4S dicluster domain-containing protein [Candidatus Binataceae bacterium]|nr:4Fe-4S dicluster domain-containing protein [Candidatus Binataceae bacterium]